jgi:hypothetical protein
MIHSFLTWTLEGSFERLTSSTRLLNPREENKVPFELEAAWAPEPVWVFLRREKSIQK